MSWTNDESVSNYCLTGPMRKVESICEKRIVSYDRRVSLDDINDLLICGMRGTLRTKLAFAFV